MNNEDKEISSSCEIRLIEEKDLPEVASIYAEAFNKADVGEKWIQEKAEKFMKYWFERQRDLFFVATYEGQIGGGIVADILPWWNGPHLVDGELFVRPELQKHGIGQRLFVTLLEEAIKKYNIVEIDGLAYKVHKFPLEWYKEIGFKETDLVHIYGNPQEVLEELKKPL